MLVYARIFINQIALDSQYVRNTDALRNSASVLVHL